jgi:hypothetical protein
MISNYNREVHKLKSRFWDEQILDSLSFAMFRSVLTPYVYEYDLEIMSKIFTQYLVVQTLEHVPGLRKLCLQSEIYAICSAQLATMVHHVRN